MLHYCGIHKICLILLGGVVQKWIPVGAQLKLLDVALSTQSSLFFVFLYIDSAYLYTVYGRYISYLVY